MREILRRARGEAGKRREQGGGEKRIAAQHAKGKLTARERIEILLDEGSFEEFDMFVAHRATDFGMAEQKYPGDGVVTGWGTINGRLTYVFSQDFTVLGGSLSETHAQKICKIMDMAMRNGAPVIGLNDSGGARIQEGVASLAGYADVFKRNVECVRSRAADFRHHGPLRRRRGLFPPAMTDFIFMVRDSSYMFVTGPDVVKTVTNEVVTAEELGGARTHTQKSSVADGAYDNDVIALEGSATPVRFPAAVQSRQAADQGPSTTIPKRIETRLDTLIPDSANKPYDMKELILSLADEADFFELQEAFAKNSVTGFMRIRGGSRSASFPTQPMVLAGCLDIGFQAAKAARFVRFLRCLQHPDPQTTRLTLRGFRQAPARNSAASSSMAQKTACSVYSQATVPMVTLITRKAMAAPMT